MARTTAEDRAQILADLGTAVDRIEVASASLADAHEQLDDMTAQRLEDELFRPLQRALARAKREYARFAARYELDAPGFEVPPVGARSQGVRLFVERAEAAAGEADRALAGLQDSMLPIESGDAELRAALAEVRDLLEEIPLRARTFLRTLGR